MRPLIRFSDAVLFPVTAAVGGKVEHQLLHRANVQLNRLKKMERSGGLGSDNTVLVVEAVRGLTATLAEMHRDMREDRALAHEAA
jgi:gamma-glutamyl:cysteine ligase YbdK (ATP-grasp superfamily)